MRRLLFVALFTSAPLCAAETISYSYDARGRLVKVQHSGTANDGIRACYIYDKADNRSKVTVAPADCVALPTPPAFSIIDASVTEGGSLVLTVTKSGATSTSFSVNYATANGSAVAGSDYTSTSDTLTFAAAESTKTITIATIDDSTVESSETVLVNLSGATGGATISDGQGVGTINDNDVPPAAPSFSINDKSGIEGSTISFTVTKSGTASSSHSVSYATADGTATAAGDYFATSGTLTFGINDVSKTITVSLRNGLAIENDETFTVNLSNATGGATISDAQGVGTIYDDDEGQCPPPGCNSPEQ